MQFVPVFKNANVKSKASDTSSLNLNFTKEIMLKKWPQAIVESNGDYREETYLENIIGGPLYLSQPKLPKLPFPTLEESIQKLLLTSLPLSKSEGEVQIFLQACQDFPQQAAYLYKRLKSRQIGDMKDSSWCQLWWNTAKYLQARDPLPLSTSYCFILNDDTTLPKNNPKFLGILRGASVLVAVAEYRKLVCSGNLSCETVGKKEPKTPLCSVAFKYMFNSCRIPNRKQDTYKIYDPSLKKHCIVACKGHFFAVDFVDDVGNALPLHYMVNSLQQCVEKSNLYDKQPGLGILTSSDRDSWADARKELKQLGGPKMENALEKLESGAFLLCLDNEETVSEEQCGILFWKGGLRSKHNRWYDKSIQFVCSKNGKLGFIGEHSMVDGMPTIGLCAHVSNKKYFDIFEKKLGDFIGIRDLGTATKVEHLFLDSFDDIIANKRINDYLEKASKDFSALSFDQELTVKHFEGYGDIFMKRNNFPPDAYVQMAIQLAAYRLFGTFTAGFAGCTGRYFMHGRTQSIRSVSRFSKLFIQSVSKTSKRDSQNSETRKNRLELFRAATRSYQNYRNEALKGKDVDNFLFGLSMLICENDKVPTLFKNPLYLRSNYWRVCTSSLPYLLCIRSQVHDGIAIGYQLKASSCLFTITSSKKNNFTSNFSRLLGDALEEIKSLIETDLFSQSKI